MKLSVICQPALASNSPYRVCDENGGEIEWANAFLDAQRLRQLSLRSVRIYAYDLLHFARWFEPQHQPLPHITESTLVAYVRHQLEQQPQPTPQTVNHRLGTVRCCYRFHTGQEIPAGKVHFQRPYTKRSPLGYGRSRPAIARGLRLKEDRRVIVPLTAEEVAKFWGTFRTYRDLGLVGLMLLDGLRSCEVLALQLEHVQLAEGQRKQATTRASAPGNLRGSLELLAAGEANDQLTCIVRFSQRPPARPAHDGSWPPLSVPPPSGIESSAPRQPAPRSTYVRNGHGARGDVPACPATTYGSFEYPHHYVLRRARATGCLE
jgi:hypothetical protein